MDNKINISIKFIIALLLFLIVFSNITIYATSYMYDSKDVSYDNSTSGIESTNVQDALDEIYDCESYYAYTKDLTVDNAHFHNSVFRGKDVTNYYNDNSLWTRISSGKFEDLYVGDYIYKNNTYWRIAGFDIYLGKGNTTDISINQAYSRHHAVIVPDYGLTTAQMNETITTENGYVGSKMYTTTLPNVLSTYIEPVFGTHILQYRSLLTTTINASYYNRYGTNSGATNNWDWQTRKLDLMNENQVYGGIVQSSSGNETGIDSIQFPLFALRPEFVVAKDASGSRQTYWLRNVVSSSNFARVRYDGHSGSVNSTGSNGVRPYFYIG